MSQIKAWRYAKKMDLRRRMESTSPGQTRKRLLATVHLAKRDLALEDESYRAILQRVTGVRSSKDLCEDGLDRVIGEFKRLGWKPTRSASPKGASRKTSSRPEVRRLWVAAREVRDAGGFTLADTGEKDWRVAVRSWVKRQTGGEEGGIDDPEFLTADQARQLIEQLKQWKTRLRKHDARAN